jgi:hypothetical protein
MRLNDIIVESQQIDELSAGDIGRGVGKVAGGVAKGVGAVAGGVAGLGKAFKKGFTTGKATVAGDEDPNAPADNAAAPTTAGDINAQGPKGTAAAKSQTGAGAQALAKTAQATANQDPAQAGQTVYAQVKSQINNLDKKGKQRILQLLQKSLQQPGPADQKAAAKPAAGAAPAAADATTAPATPASEPVTPFGSEPAATTAPAADATTAPTRTQGGGKVAGVQSQTPGAIKKRAQRAAAANAPAAEPAADQTQVAPAPEAPPAEQPAPKKTRSRKAKPAQPSQAEIDADREARMGPTSDSIIRTGNNLSEALAQRILKHKQRLVKEGQVKIFR